MTLLQQGKREYIVKAVGGEENIFGEAKRQKRKKKHPKCSEPQMNFMTLMLCLDSGLSPKLSTKALKKITKFVTSHLVGGGGGGVLKSR